MAQHEPRRLTPAEILAQIPAARAHAKSARATGRRAVAVAYELRRKELRLTFPNGTSVGIPVVLIPALAGAPVRALRAVDFSPSGASLHFAELDVDLSVPALLGIALKGTPAARVLGAIAGSATSERKADASRRNGAKGGRPRKRVAYGSGKSPRD